MAGGGHTHAMVLKEWIMRPERRPKRMVTLINRSSTTLYSGMIPGMIGGVYKREDLVIDIRKLCELAGVAFVQAEITGLDKERKCLYLHNRTDLNFRWLSLDLGAVSRKSAKGIGIKPIEEALSFVEGEDDLCEAPLRVVGAGAAGIEVVLGLRRRWPKRRLELKERYGQLGPGTRKILERANINLVDEEKDVSIPTLLCTGSKGQNWLKNAGLPLNSDGRIKTDSCLRVEGNKYIFATGDCGIISKSPRPASGVWAVKAGKVLAKNLEAICSGKQLQSWRPQRNAIQIIGTEKNEAWIKWGKWQLGPSKNFWKLKKRIDKSFMDSFKFVELMDKKEISEISCRGCAAKLGAESLQGALNKTGLSGDTEDAAIISKKPWILQTIDGFPALISDPWLNGRITALHACSDIWSCGGEVTSAMLNVTLPLITKAEQEEILAQTIGGVKAALEEQGAILIGGHTMESRSKPTVPVTTGVQLAITANGITEQKPWMKKGIKRGDILLISRPLGTGLLFAGLMHGETKAEEIEKVLSTMNESQHEMIKKIKILGVDINACTDITGFGLLGHLNEMLEDNNEIKVILNAEKIPAYDGVHGLIKKGIRSTLAPENSRAYESLNEVIELEGKNRSEALELLIDPQTCGPLLISCQKREAELMKRQGWKEIGSAVERRQDV